MTYGWKGYTPAYKDINKMSKGEGFNRKTWWSICSAHYPYESTCRLCNCGHWQLVWKWYAGHTLHDMHYRIWFWFANRRDT